MINKADIVTFKGLDAKQIGLVDKVIEIDGVKHAIIHWIKPRPNHRSFLPVARLKTLRTRKEAAARGRKKLIPGLAEGSESHTTRFVKENE